VRVLSPKQIPVLCSYSMEASGGLRGNVVHPQQGSLNQDYELVAKLSPHIKNEPNCRPLAVGQLYCRHQFWEVSWG
jgi:hypothetical protein